MPTVRKRTTFFQAVKRRPLVWIPAFMLAAGLAVFVIYPAFKYGHISYMWRSTFVNAQLVRLGEYPLGAGRTIELSENPDGILLIVLSGPGGELMRSNVSASLYQGWAVMVDGNDDCVWLYSSDIGTSVWCPSPDGYKRDDGPSILSRMPEGLWQLPPYLKPLPN